jgi:hypothetical protein
VSLPVLVGLALAVLTALTSVVGFLLKYRGALAAPLVEWRRPVSSSLALFRSPLYTVGIVVATAGWGLHVGALALAPISLVQSVIAGGLVLLTVVADRVFRVSVTRREWLGVALMAAGLAVLAATLDRGARGALNHYTPATLGLYVGLLTILGSLAWARARDDSRGASALALSAGLLWGASDVSIKALSGNLHADGAGVLLHPLALVILCLSLLGLLVSARSLQLGDAVTVIALTSAAANVCTIAAGPLVFGEPVPSGAFGATARALAFALVVAAAALTPPPIPRSRTATPPARER